MNLTYTQYITLTALWKNDGASVGALCKALLTDTGTLTPVLKRLEKLGHITRTRSKTDERQVIIHLTQSGIDLKQKAPDITKCVIKDTQMTEERLETMITEIALLRDNLLNQKV